MPDHKVPLMSIIIPVYNVEKYLRHCVDSVLAQMFQDYEIILVDDGSPDGCPAICDEYAAVDKRIRVIHKENGGPSAARNAGMLASKGKYLLFIDGDDFIGENSLVKAAETLEADGDTDVIFFNVAYYYDGGIKYFDSVFKKDRLYKKSHMEVLTFLASMSDFATSACLKLMKRELLVSNDIFFHDIIWGEDTDFSMKLYLCANTYNYCEAYIYYYRKERESSITFSFSEKKFTCLLYVISKWVREAEENPNYKRFSEVIHSFFAFQYCLLLSGFHKISRTARKEWKMEVKKYAWLLRRTKDRRVLLIRACYRLFGLHFTSAALCIYEKVKK